MKIVFLSRPEVRSEHFRVWVMRVLLFFINVNESAVCVER